MLRSLSRSLTARVVVAMCLGVIFGLVAPGWARQCQFLSDMFVRMVKMVIAPIVFTTVACGLGSVGSLGEVGALGLRATLYFEAVTSVALFMGVFVAHALQPGAGVDFAAIVAHAPTALPTVTLAPAAAATVHQPGHFGELLVRLVPDSAIGALAGSDMLPILVFAVFFGLAIGRNRTHGASIRASLDKFAQIFFDIIGMVMVLSPLAAFGAMAFAIGQFGLGSLAALAKLLASVAVAMLAFMTLVLAPICRFYGFRLTRLLRLIWPEVALVFGTSSSESALPSLMERLREAGCSRSVVGLVVPTGYSFNLDGTSIYLSTAVLFLAQVYQVELDWTRLAWILGVLLVTSKGAAGVTGSGFITLAATLSALPGQPIPLEGLALLVGVDRFMSAGRALTNLVGNSVATVVLAKSVGQYQDRGLLGG